MKVLLISPYIPYPPITGGKVRVYNFLKKLSKKHEIVLICLLKNTDEFKDVKVLEKQGFKIYPVLRRKAWSVQNLLRTLFTKYSFLTVVNNFSTETESLILEVIEKEKPDLIHLETFYMAQSLLAVRDKIKIPILLAEVDVEAQVYFRNAKQQKNPLLKLIGYIDAKKMLNYEVQVCQYFDKVTFASEVDRKLLSSHLKKKNISVSTDIVPNGVDTKHYHPTNIAKYPKPTVVFLGNFRYFANTDAVFYFVKNIWPLILKEIDAHLYIVGPLLPKGIQRLLSNDVAKLGSTNITVTGFVEEEVKKEILTKSWLSVAPIRIGSGTKLKILESMAIGTPVVATPIGIEGIEAVDNQSVLIGDGTKQVAEKVITLLNDKLLRKKVSKNARKLVEDVYEWDVISSKLDEIYRDLTDKRKNGNKTHS